MKKALVTQAFGDKWHKVLELTKPRMEAYFERHKIDLISIERPLVEPVQYSKLAIGNIIATKGYEQVTFLDCDILVTEDCDEIGALLEPDCTFMAFDEGSYLDRKPGLRGLPMRLDMCQDGSLASTITLVCSSLRQRLLVRYPSRPLACSQTILQSRHG